MSQGTDGYVQVLPDSSGKQIRNLAIPVVVAGVPTTLYMQVTTAADKDGYVVDMSGAQTNALLRDILRAMQTLIAHHEVETGQKFPVAYETSQPG
jgi:hypothetical protein